jgi:hypothetical protein
MYKNAASCVNEFRDKLLLKLEQLATPEYEPTGLQEDIIYTVGLGKSEIVLALHPNDVGKTRVGVEILKNIIWPCNPKWFAFWDGYSVFRDKQWPLKAFRITGTTQALSDAGAMQTEIAKSWPAGEYLWTRGAKRYNSDCVCKNGWSGDALTYNQDRTEFESRKIDVCLSDEPPKAAIVGAITSRFTDGMLWIVCATPYQCGAFLDIIGDLEEKGTRVKRLTGTAHENSKTSGKPNHLNTRRGLRTDEEIESKIARCPIEERPARIYGLASNKSGKIYPMFEENAHVIDFDYHWLPDCNLFMSIDPHRKYYPAIMWYAVTPGHKVIIYNEYPKFEMFNAYYDEIRNTEQFNKDAKQLADIILANDMTLQYGGEIVMRCPDPYFDEVEDFVKKMIEHGVSGWNIPERERIEIQRNNLRELMGYNPALGVWTRNDVSVMFDRRCKNVIRAVSRHHWDEEKDKEAELYKDFCDSIRAFLAAVGGKPVYIEPKKRDIQRAKPISLAQHQLAGMPAQGYRLSPVGGKR